MQNAYPSIPAAAWDTAKIVSQFIHLNEETPVVEGLVQAIKPEPARTGKDGTEYGEQTVITFLLPSGQIRKLGLPSYYGFLNDIMVAHATHGANHVAVRLECVGFTEVEGKEHKKREIIPKMIIV